MRRVLLMAMVLLTITAAFGQEPPAVTAVNTQSVFLPADVRTIVDAPGAGSTAVLRDLSSKSIAEKRNMILDVIADGTDVDRATARRGATRWNEGDFEGAMSLLGSITRVPLAYGVAYRSPHPAKISGATAADIQIGVHDSVYKVTLAYDPASKNLFCVLLFKGESFLTSASYNFSSDGGNTWREIYYQRSMYAINDIGLTLVDKYFVVAAPFLTNSVVWLSRFSRTTGNPLLEGGFLKYQHVFDAVGGFTYDEVTCSSNKDFANNFAYVTAIRSDHHVNLAVVTDTSASGVYDVASNANSARRGISIAFNQGAGSILFVSYVDTLEKVCVDTLANTVLGGGTLSRRARFSTTHGGYGGTSIGAWKDTILVAYSAIYNSNTRAFYEISYDGGAAFAFGFIGDTLQTSELPVVAMDRGMGLAAVYRYYTPIRELRFTSRTYKFGTWSTPVKASGIEPYVLPAAIVYTDSGKYAMVNISWSSPALYGAYFSTVKVTPATGVEQDASRAPVSFELSQNYPNPFNPSTVIRYALPYKSNVSLTVFNSVGQQVARLVNGEMEAGYHEARFDGSILASGVYFYRLRAGDFVETKRMLVLK